MNIHEFRNTLIRVSYAIKIQRTYNALETHMKREFAGQIRGQKCTKHTFRNNIRVSYSFDPDQNSPQAGKEKGNIL